MKKEVNDTIISSEKLVLHLFVSGMSVKSMEAIENIRQLCNEHLHNAVDLEVTDIYKNPESAVKHHIIFSPSLIKVSPLPKKIIIGTLADKEKVIKALGVTFKK